MPLLPGVNPIPNEPRPQEKVRVPSCSAEPPCFTGPAFSSNPPTGLRGAVSPPGKGQICWGGSGHRAPSASDTPEFRFTPQRGKGHLPGAPGHPGSPESPGERMTNSSSPSALPTSPPGLGAAGRPAAPSGALSPEPWPVPNTHVATGMGAAQRAGRPRGLSLCCLPVHKATSRAAWPFPVVTRSLFPLHTRHTKKSSPRTGAGSSSQCVPTS